MKQDINGRMRHWLIVEVDRGTDKRANGERIEKWEENFAGYAAVEPLSGREFFNAVQVQADITHKITLRYRGDRDLTSAMRLRLVRNFRTRTFHLAGPPRNVGERDEYWELFAIEVSK